MRISDWSSDVCSSDLDREDACGDHDRFRARDRLRADGDRDRNRRRSAEAARDYRHRRPHRGDHPDASRPARDRQGRTRSRLAAEVPQAESGAGHPARSEEHTSELQSLMRISYAVFCLKKKKQYTEYITNTKTTN